MTAFRILAEKIAKGKIERPIWCCAILPEIEANYLEDYFKPNSLEFRCYKMNDIGWLGSRELSNAENDSFRILILLFAEQHYKHYKKIDDEN